MLNKIIFLICFLLSLASKAANLDPNLNPSECRNVFKPPPSIKPLPHKKTPTHLEIKENWHGDYLTKIILQLDFKKEVESKKQFPGTWKKDVLENIFLLDTAQIWNLVRNIKSFTNDTTIISEEAFFQSLALEITPIIPKFDKQSLIEILYTFSFLEITMPDKFIQAWRKQALELKQNFNSSERYFLSSIFRKLEIPPLKKSL